MPYSTSLAVITGNHGAALLQDKSSVKAKLEQLKYTMKQMAKTIEELDAVGQNCHASLETALAEELCDAALVQLQTAVMPCCCCGNAHAVDSIRFPK